jgi:hypothetical protein
MGLPIFVRNPLEDDCIPFPCSDNLHAGLKVKWLQILSHSFPVRLQRTNRKLENHRTKIYLMCASLFRLCGTQMNADFFFLNQRNQRFHLHLPDIRLKPEPSGPAEAGGVAQV